MKRRDIMNKLLKSKYDVVLDILAKYDPVGLADLCGKNEYSIEAIDIANRAGVLEVDDLAEWCKEVFLFWFSKCGNNVNWHDMATEIKEKIG